MSDIAIDYARDARERARTVRVAQGVLKPVEAAEYLRSTENCLRSLRSTGKGPPFHKDHGRVFYLKDELDGYLAEKERGASRETGMRP